MTNPIMIKGESNVLIFVFMVDIQVQFQQI